MLGPIISDNDHYILLHHGSLWPTILEKKSEALHSHCWFSHVTAHFSQRLSCLAWADPEGGQGVRTPPENHQNIGFLSKNQYWSGFPEISQSYQASIQCGAIIGTPTKRHLNGVWLAANDGPLSVVFGSPSPHQLKIKHKQKNKKMSNWLDPL